MSEREQDFLKERREEGGREGGKRKMKEKEGKEVVRVRENNV